MTQASRWKILLACLGLGLALACSAGLNRSQVKSTLAKVPELKAMGAEIDPLEIVQVDGDHAVATANVLLTFQLDRQGGRWEAAEIRTGDNEWVEIKRLRQSLADMRHHDTEAAMLETARGLAGFFHRNGCFPQPAEPVQLSDLLYPAFMSRPLGLDAWGNPFRYRILDQGARYRLVSAGPDRDFNSEDDLVLEDGRFHTRADSSGERAR